MGPYILFISSKVPKYASIKKYVCSGPKEEYNSSQHTASHQNGSLPSMGIEAGDIFRFLYRQKRKSIIFQTLTITRPSNLGSKYLLNKRKHLLIMSRITIMAY